MVDALSRFYSIVPVKKYISYVYVQSTGIRNYLNQ